ncbi:MAG: tRNA (adenosine(37)-N6)-threonylcarbamoyltransferase complex ATPase subunit type 1 TsaE [Flavobacteriaceae bacterium]
MKSGYTRNDLSKLAKELLADDEVKTLCFYGAMGSGKTTLIKSIVQELGGTDTASSPTFGIVNEYHYKDGSLLGYHFDFYRINDEMEALDLGLEDYLGQHVWIFIEWPENIPSFIPEKVKNIHITILDEVTRDIVQS